MAKRIDLTGQRFGRLVVVSYNEEVSKQKNGAHWNCKCDCGNEIVIYRGSLRKGKTQSCGCLQKERAKQKWQDEEFRRVQRESSSQWLKQKWQDEEYRQMKSNRMREVSKHLWQDEEFRQAQSNRMREMVKQKWQDEEYRHIKSDKMREVAKHQWQDKEFRQMQSNKMRERWQDEEFRQMQSDKAREMNWKGGITPISTYLRNLNEEWFNRCKQEANYTCQLTGKRGGNLHTHHLYAFSSIVMDAHNTYNIQIKEQVKDYTKEELKLLEDYVAEWHKDGSNAVVLSKEAHKLFHSKEFYGQGNNTPEQFEEFKQRYLDGEFNEILEEMFNE